MRTGGNWIFNFPKSGDPYSSVLSLFDTTRHAFRHVLTENVHKHTQTNTHTHTHTQTHTQHTHTTHTHARTHTHTHNTHTNNTHTHTHTCTHNIRLCHITLILNLQSVQYSVPILQRITPRIITLFALQALPFLLDMSSQLTTSTSSQPIVSTCYWLTVHTSKCLSRASLSLSNSLPRNLQWRK